VLKKSTGAAQLWQVPKCTNILSQDPVFPCKLWVRDLQLVQAHNLLAHRLPILAPQRDCGSPFPPIHIDRAEVRGSIDRAEPVRTGRPIAGKDLVDAARGDLDERVGCEVVSRYKSPTWRSPDSRITPLAAVARTRS
jgi:hypothetical protein